MFPLNSVIAVIYDKKKKNKKNIVYLKIPFGNNAHEDTQIDIIYKHDRRQSSLSRICYYFISNQWWRWLINYVDKHPVIKA